MEANATTSADMNKYTVKFFCKCPANGIRIEYCLSIITNKRIDVEMLIDEVSKYEPHELFHEDIADDLLNTFGGKQELKAFHHGVHIETFRVSPNTQS
jgi:hypothetical protein